MSLTWISVHPAPKIPIMVLLGTIWSFQVLNRVLYLWQPEAPKRFSEVLFFLECGRPRGKLEAKWVAGNGCSKFLRWVPYSNSLLHIPRSSKFPKNEGRGSVWATVWQWMADPEEYRSCNQRKAQPYNKLQISSLDGHGTGSALQFSGPLCRSKHVIARKNLLPELLPNATPYFYNSYVQSMPSAMKLWLPKSWLIINCQSW